jgi:hypothetical protein
MFANYECNTGIKKTNVDDIINFLHSLTKESDYEMVENHIRRYTKYNNFSEDELEKFINYADNTYPLAKAYNIIVSFQPKILGKKRLFYNLRLRKCINKLSKIANEEKNIITKNKLNEYVENLNFLINR